MNSSDQTAALSPVRGPGARGALEASFAGCAMDPGESPALDSTPFAWSRHHARHLPILLLAIVVLFHFNIWPGTLPNSASFFLFAGNAQCVANEFPNLDFLCDANGYPSGLAVAFGYPHVWLTAALHRLTPFDLLNSFRIVWAVTLMLGLYGARRLFGLFTTSRWIAWGLAGIYLLSPIVLGQPGYGPLQLGFALVPCYILVDTWFMKCVDERNRVVLSGALVFVTRTFALFTDGYSFVMSVIPICLLYLMWGVRRISRPDERIYVAGAWLSAAASTLVAYVLYTRLVGGDEFSAMSTDFFRGQGVDVFALAVPPNSNWLASSLGLHHSVGATQAFSDGRNLHDVYLGWCLTLTAIGGAVWAFRHRLSSKMLAAVAAAGVIGFVFALGPSLKVSDFRTSEEFERTVPSADAYYMRASEATMPTGLAWLYQHLPGIDTMRALYRWELLVKLALLVFCAVALGALARKGRWVLVALIMLVVLGESVRSPRILHTTGTSGLHTVDRFTRDVVAPLHAYVRSGERAVLVNPVPGGSGNNFYLANWMCPLLDLRCYNAGGDKGIARALEHQSPAVQSVMFSHDDLVTNIDQLFTTDEVDVVILVNFDMRVDAYAWPPTPGRREIAQASGQQIVNAGDYDAVTLTWATVVRPAAE